MTRMTVTKGRRHKMEGGFTPAENKKLKTFTYSNGKKIEILVAEGQIINPMKLYKKHFPSQWD